MASDVAMPRTFRARDRRLLARIGMSRASLALAGMVGVSFAVRFGAAIRHSRPFLFPDEYIYSELARSLAQGRVTIRGHAAHFPALLEPILAAPFWLFADVETAFRLTQAANALTASLVAVPVYLLARQAKLPPWQQLACGAAALALPSLVYASYSTADSLGLTLAVTAIYLGVRALESPTRAAQIWFLATAGLAAFARVQYVVLVVAFAVGVVAVEAGDVRALRRYWLSAAVVGVPVVAAIALGPSRSLGYYHNVLHLHVDLGVARWLGSDAMLLVYACGFVLVPVALTGIVAALFRPESRLERGRAAFVATTAVLLLAEASLYAANGSARFQERYLVVLPPLVPILFFVALQRRRSLAQRVATATVAIAFVLIAVLVPLSGYASGFSSLDSPLLQAVLQLELLTSVALGSLLVALVVLVLAPVAILPAWRRPAAVAAVVGSFVVLGAAAAASTSIDFKSSKAAAELLPADPRWVDHSGLRDVSLLVTRSTYRPVVSAHLFWNREISRVLQMPGSEPVDSFGSTATTVDRDGTLIAGGTPVVGPLLVEEYADTVTFANARVVQRTPGTSLWRGTGTIRVVTLTNGRYLDGWLALPRTTVTVWPALDRPRRGVVCFSLSLPANARETQMIVFQGRGVDKRVPIGAGQDRTVGIPVPATRGPWTLSISSTHAFRLGDRLVSVHAEPPRLLRDNAGGTQVEPPACR